MRVNDYNKAMTESTQLPSPEAHTKQAAPSAAPSSLAAESSLRLRRKSSGPSWPTTLAIVCFVISLVVVGGAWFQQKRFDSAGREVAAQVQGFTAQLVDTKREAKQALATVEAQARLINELQKSLTDAKERFDVLEQSWTAFNQGMEDSMLANDIDRLVTLASQQLRLASNVNNAVMALETALSTLVRADRPRFVAVKRAISADLDRLRTVPLVDVGTIAVRLDMLTTLIGRAPLLVPDAAAPRAVAIAPSAVEASATPLAPATNTTSLTSATTPLDSSDTWWGAALNKTLLWSKAAAVFMAKELASVVSIQRVNDASALLLSSEQVAQLRANLRTRVLTAQMALLMHQPAVWRAEMANIEAALMARYDPKAADTIAAVRLVRELASVPVSAALPDMTESIAALEAVRLQELNNKSED